MSVLKQNKLFGSPLRTRLLVAIALVEESYSAELARLLDAKLFPVQRLVDALELEGILATRKIGLERRVTLNPRYFASKELTALLLRLGEADQELQEKLLARRSRPRRKGKLL
jgi:hypothetical protein